VVILKKKEMKVVGINGFGRIGRCFTRLSLNQDLFDVAVVNDPADINILAHLFKYDSVHGPLKLNFTITDNVLVFENGKKILFTHFHNPEEINWQALGVEVVIESSGLFLTKELAGKHLNSGAKRVVISAPSTDSDIKTLVLGVNDELLSQEDRIISNASCTTNNVAPMLKVINSLVEIELAHISTTHSFTSDQRLQDAPHKDLRRARAASHSIVPTTTGATKAIMRVFPDLATKISGSSVRVPVINGSMTELTIITESKISVEDINRAMKHAAENELKGILGYTEDPIVSVDVIGSSYSCLFDAQLTTVFHKMIRLVGWYDNEMGYSNRLVDLISKF
jgi:glyceraldehyde 3-phosphate dehydrogenase